MTLVSVFTGATLGTEGPEPPEDTRLGGGPGLPKSRASGEPGPSGSTRVAGGPAVLPDRGDPQTGPTGGPAHCRHHTQPDLPPGNRIMIDGPPGIPVWFPTDPAAESTHW